MHVSSLFACRCIPKSIWNKLQTVFYTVVIGILIFIVYNEFKPQSADKERKIYASTEIKSGFIERKDEFKMSELKPKSSNLDNRTGISFFSHN